MTETMGDTEGIGLILYSGSRDELQAKLRARDDEITRLRLQLKGMANVIDDLVMAIELPGDHCETHIALCAAKAALKKAGVT